ncbi:MAG: CRTAC1 family protein [Thermoanaerobaculia bacterium]
MRIELQPGRRRPAAVVAACLAAGGVALAQGPSDPAAGPPAAGIFVELQGSGLDFVHCNGMTGKFYMVEINSGGGGMLDYDNDGDLDLYLVQGQLLGSGEEIGDAGCASRHPLPLSDRLYRNDLTVHPDGRREIEFTDVTEAIALPAAGYGYGLAAGDYDNDGWVDLYVANFGPNTLLRNNGDGAFADVTASSGSDDERWSVPASFVDYDRDGWLDLFVGNYLDFTFAGHKTCRTATGAMDYCGPEAYVGVPNRLLRNRGDGSFVDVTTAAGLGRARSKSLGVVAADLNGDRRLDLYVTNDLAANQMWIQDERGRFSDEALLAGSAVNSMGRPEASMGVDAGDFDGDGDEDLFMTHLTRETNTLYLNDGHGMFEDATTRTGLGPPSLKHTAWGTGWFDYDNDGWLEMVVANGAVRVIQEQADRGDPYPFRQPNQLFRNLGNGRFADVSELAGETFQLLEVSRAIAVGDLDNDGDSDILLVNNNGPARVLLNNLSGGHWLGVRLVGGAGRRDMLGARVALLRPGRPPLWRRVQTGGGFAAVGDPRVLFGLGDVTEVEAVRAYWPGGEVEEWRGLPIDRYTLLEKGTGTPVR